MGTIMRAIKTWGLAAAFALCVLIGGGAPPAFADEGSFCADATLSAEHADAAGATDVLAAGGADVSDSVLSQVVASSEDVNAGVAGSESATPNSGDASSAKADSAPSNTGSASQTAPAKAGAGEGSQNDGGDAQEKTVGSEGADGAVSTPAEPENNASSGSDDLGSPASPPQAPQSPDEAKTADAVKSSPASGTANQSTESASKTGSVSNNGVQSSDTADNASALTATSAAKSSNSPKTTAPLANGRYVIVSSARANAVLDVEGASTKNGANVELYTWNTGNNQRWALVRDSQGRYLIKSVQSGKVLTVAGGKAKASANVAMRDDAGNAAQRWILEKDGIYYRICSALDLSFAIGTVKASAANGSNCALYKANSANAQKFAFVPLFNPKVGQGAVLANGVYTLGMASKKSQKVDVEGASMKGGANVLSWHANGNMNQWWQITHCGDGLYRIQSVESGLCLDVAGESVLATSNVIQWKAAKKGAANQLWGIEKNPDGTYSFISRLSGMALEVAGGSTADKANVRVSYRVASAASQKFLLDKPELLPNGTYQLFTKLDQTRKSVDISGCSLSNGAQAIIWDASGGTNQHFIIKKYGDAYSLQLVSSGKFLTARQGKVVQTSFAKKGAKQDPAQLWNVSYSGGFVFKNVGDGKVLDVSGAKASNNAKMITWKWNGGANQKYRPVKCAIISNGLYTLSSAANTQNCLDVNGARYRDGTNVALWKANGNNNQKFWIASAGGGYYRISMPLGDELVEVKGASKKAANVDVWHTNGGGNQVWKPEVTDGGLVFVNKNSGLVLGAAKKGACGENVSQVVKTGAATQKWQVGSTGLNFADTGSFINAMSTASGGHLHVSNGVAGWAPKSGDWNALRDAIDSCGFGLGFILTDCNTGTVISYNPDSSFYGASTIKALWVTYLCEEYVAKGRLSWGQISGLAVPTIVNSNNETYGSLRAQYGSESGFASWLNSVGVGYIGKWGTYTPRKLQQAWVHMLSYSNSNKTGSGSWRATFDHSYMSSVNDALGDYRTTYSKPGWMGPGNSTGSILNDSSVVVGSGGRQYLLTVMSNANPWGQKGQLERVVRALDRIQSTIPSHR